MRDGRTWKTVATLAGTWLAIVAAMAAVRLAVVPALEAIGGLGPDAASAARRVGLPAAAVLTCAAMSWWIEGRAPTDLRPRAVPALLGGLAGAGLLAGCVLGLVLAGVYHPIDVRPPGPALPAMIGLIAAAALLEEVLYRAVLLRIVEGRWGTGPALALSAVVFGAAHLENGDGSVAASAGIFVSVTLLGLLWGLVYVATRNLWAAAAHHAGWNLAIALSGVPLSGLPDWQVAAPLVMRIDGPAWLTGGAFGPEASVVTMAAVALASAALARGIDPRCVDPALEAR